MSEKRYFKVEYDEEWYLFDSTTISKQLVEEQAEYGYGIFANSLSPSEVVDLLNKQEKKIERLSAQKKVLLDHMGAWCPKRFYNEIIRSMNEV